LFEVAVSQRARKTSKRIPEHDKRRIDELVLVLRMNPVPAKSFNVKKPGEYKILLECASAMFWWFTRFCGSSVGFKAFWRGLRGQLVPSATTRRQTQGAAEQESAVCAKPKRSCYGLLNPPTTTQID
jgi:hypothetical protein